MKLSGWIQANIYAALVFAAVLISCGGGNGTTGEGPSFGIVIHGGAGTIVEATMSPGEEEQYRAKLLEALNVGHTVLADGGTSLDAIERAINIMEDSPLFNAGKGAVFTAEGTNELDASIMDGKTLNAGAVAGVRNIKNPITAARLVMEQSTHVMMAGEGAEVFAQRHGIETVPEDYFFTRRRWDAMMERREREQSTEGHDAAEQKEHGTVGAVAAAAGVYPCAMPGVTKAF